MSDEREAKPKGGPKEKDGQAKARVDQRDAMPPAPALNQTAEEVEAETTPAEIEGEGQLTLKLVNENWKQILSLVRRQSSQVEALLRSGRLLGDMVGGARICSMGLISALLMAVSACHRAPTADLPLAKPISKHEIADRQARVPNEYLVTLAAGMDESAIREIFGRLGIQEVNVLRGETYLLILKIDPGPGAMEDMVRGDTRFVAVQPNLIYWANRSRKGAQ